MHIYTETTRNDETGEQEEHIHATVKDTGNTQKVDDVNRRRTRRRRT